MKLFIVFIVFLVGFIAGAISHELDIYRECSEQGNSSYAMWTVSIICEPSDNMRGNDE